MTTVSRARTRLSHGVSAVALGAAALMLIAAPVQAQDASAPGGDPQAGAPTGNPNPNPTPAATGTPGDAPDSTSAAAAGDELVVTGFRGALRNATVKKKNSEVVVESVSAEDIGKLPDNGIGESIARLPGISSQRNAGRANIISIRGFGPDFSTTTLNGRQQTTTNDSRAVEFDQYPSEVLAGVDVYKTAEADHTAGGLVGQIDLRTIRPLDTNQRIIAVGARGTYVDQNLQPDSTDKGWRGYGTFVDKFADGRVGVALSAAYTDEPYQTRDFNAWGFGGYPGGGTGMSGVKTWVESDRLKRFGTNGTIQAQLNDDLVATVDGFYSHFVDRIDQRGFEMPFLCGGGCGHDQVLSDTVNSNGLVTAATIMGTPVIENYANDRVADQYSFAGNLKWDNHNGWKALGDLSWSRTTRTDENLQTTAGLGHAVPNATATVSYNLTDHGPEFTSDYNGASPNLVLTDVEGWTSSPIQAGYDNVRHTKDDLVEARGEIERDIGAFNGFIKSVKAGVDYTTHTKTLDAQEGFLSPPGGAATAAIPSDLLLSPVTLDRGLGPILTYDPRQLVGAGVLDYIANTYGDTKGYSVEENVWTPYLMANLDGHIGSSVLTGNIGVQGVHTSVDSSGQAFPTVTDDYWMVLPSANFNLRTESDFVIRVAASKEMMRARLPDMNNVITFGPDTTRNPVIYSGSGGNPRLRPYQAWAFDLNFEKYFGSRGYVALQLFYKDITKYISNGYTFFDYSGLPTPPGVVPSSPVGLLFANVNTDGGHAYGAELAGTLPFEVFSQALTGFGLTGGLGYTQTAVTDFNGAITAIPGYSKYVASLTAFYEKNGFSARGSMRYRSSYTGDFALYSGGLDRQLVNPETVFDAQIGYDFKTSSTSWLNGVSIYLQGQNLTDERSSTVPGGNFDPLAYLKYQTYGRRFVLGVTAKF